jgi:hypothetical protein
MAVSGLAASTQFQPANQQLSQSSGHHRHHGGHHMSISDIDAQSSSVASAPTSTGKVGSRLNVTV